MNSISQTGSVNLVWRQDAGGATGAGGNHNHAIDAGVSGSTGSGAATWDLKYVDLIVCTRDA